MSLGRRRLVMPLALACLLAPGATLADPFYLPPFLDRAPALGDRWVYAASVFGTVHWLHHVEAVEVSGSADGWRFVGEDRREIPDPEPNWIVPPPSVVRMEWLLDADGAIRRGDHWTNGVLVRKRRPMLVVRELPRSALEPSRFQYVGRFDGKRRRGSLSLLPAGAGYVPPGAFPSVDYVLQLRGRSQPQVSVTYEHPLGRTGWYDGSLVLHTLVSAVIDGVAYER